MNGVAILRSMGSLTFDAVISERHTAELEVTKNPVEMGASITDHAYVKPYGLTITGGVSATPLHEPNDSYGQGNDRPSAAYEAMLKLQATREPFDVVTGLKLYKNMMVTSITTEQDKDSAGVFAFSAELTEVIIVYTEVVKYPPRQEGTTHNQASKAKDQGKKQGKAPVEEKAAKKETVEQSSLQILRGVGKKDKDGWVPPSIGG